MFTVAPPDKTGPQALLHLQSLGNNFIPAFHPSQPVALECRLATTIDDLLAIQDLRRIAFYADVEGELEDEAPNYRYEETRFDDHCDHLMLIDHNTGSVVATCRVLSGLRSLDGMDFSAAQEFDLEPFDHHRRETTEFSLICLHPEYDPVALQQHLFRAMTAYARANNSRYLLGAVSLDTGEPKVGAAIFGSLTRQQVAPVEWQTAPCPAWASPLCSISDENASYPRVLQHHLSLGAKICAPPAIDRRFNTVSFLVLHTLAAAA